MFGKNKNSQPTTAPKSPAAPSGSNAPASAAPTNAQPTTNPLASAVPARPNKPNTPSVLAADIIIKGDIETSGDIQVEGHVKGNIRAHLLTIGEGARIEGEISADDATIHGNVRGTVRGLKVRLTSSASVEGDLVHKTISIEPGAFFQGSAIRKDDPLSDAKAASPVAPKAAE